MTELHGGGAFSLTAQIVEQLVQAKQFLVDNGDSATIQNIVLMGE